MSIQCLVHGEKCLHCGVACGFEDDLLRKELSRLKSEIERKDAALKGAREALQKVWESRDTMDSTRQALSQIDEAMKEKP